jgi:hypothetical protein
MKTKHFIFTLAALVLCATILPATAASRFSSDKPEVTYLFRHTPDRPYDIKRLSWYGGIMERIVAVSKSGEPVTVHFEIVKIANALVVNPARGSTINKVCLPHQETVIADMMSRNAKSAISFQFTHDARFENTAATRENIIKSQPASPQRFAANMGGVL